MDGAQVIERTGTVGTPADPNSRSSKQSEFFSSLAHEIKTPLSSIRAFADILLNHEDEPVETRHRFLGIIREECERLGEMVEDFLAFGNSLERWSDCRMEALPLGSFVDYSVSAIQALAEEKDVRISLGVEAGLPTVLGDKTKLIQVMENLLSNAVKYSPPGGVISVEAKRGSLPETGPEMIRVSVSDQGVGIGPSQASLLFERWSKLRNEGNQVGGNGLGLCISREIIESHGGKIWVESVPGAGSTLVLSLPVYDCPSLFQGTLGWAMKTARSRGEDLTLILLAPEECGDSIDAALLRFADLAASCARFGDRVIEFERPGVLAVLARCGLDGARTLARRIQKLWSQQEDMSGRCGLLSSVVQCGAEHRDATAFLAAAEHGLSVGSSAGRESGVPPTSSERASHGDPGGARERGSTWVH